MAAGSDRQCLQLHLQLDQDRNAQTVHILPQVYALSQQAQAMAGGELCLTMHHYDAQRAARRQITSIPRPPPRWRSLHSTITDRYWHVGVHVPTNCPIRCAQLPVSARTAKAIGGVRREHGRLRPYCYYTVNLRRRPRAIPLLCAPDNRCSIGPLLRWTS